MENRNNNAERGGFVDAEQYAALRKEHMNAQIEIEKLRGELERLAPYKTKWLDKVKTDLLSEYQIPDEQREYWAERITGDSEDELKASVERLHNELKLSAKPPYVDPSLINPRSNRPTSNVKKALYETGRKAAEKVLGVNNGATRVIDRNYGIGAKRSAAPVPKPQYRHGSTPSRSEKHRRESILQQFRRFLAGK
ncbi:hypothetical protein [Thermoactinomyces sp. CICC 10522]|uniref:hypothetical protein n=1 Tax=Thermoactinomyces sp. CICC 10522 TaxID=2767427 RepID=UPI0018DB1395|nr:hypothetical protein [Thermoactinomyces sp. CICC 10522]MBH8603666.1 hypothetical protein [Thermoactinomyces sp. CICC 10522]